MTEEEQVKIPFTGGWANTILRVWLPTALGMLAVIVGLYIFSVEPPPPKNLVIAAGSKAGAYYKFALQYKAALQKEGIQLKVLNTAGSVSNMDLIATSNVNIAFIQGGIFWGKNHRQDTRGLRSLGSLYSEPMWVFYRGTQPLRYLSQLKGKKIAIGSVGSGTRRVALTVLHANEVTSSNSSFRGGSSTSAAAQLQAGTIDAAFFVTSPKASYIQTLSRNPNIRLMNFKRHRGYAHRFPYLSKVELGPGLLNMASNVPSRTTNLLAPAATLVVQKEFPPSLVYLLMKTLQEIHSKGNLIDTPNKFPSKQFVNFPMHDQAKYYLRYGPSWLQRNLPFWWATLFQRFWILGFSLLTLLYPLFKMVPLFYTWGARSRIFRWYKILREIDNKLLSKSTVEELEAYLPELDKLDQESRGIRVPLWHMSELYTLRIHIHYLRTQINRMRVQRGDTLSS